MTLSYEEFLKDIFRFLDLSNPARDGWSLREIDDVKYLCKKSSFLDQNWLCDYHVVYNVSYSVPTLYFSVTKVTGELVSLKELWPHLSVSESNKWSMITQTEHPLLSTPYFYVHPCHTASMMKNNKDSFYLLTWLSSLAPIVGLQLPLFIVK